MDFRRGIIGKLLRISTKSVFNFVTSDFNSLAERCAVCIARRSARNSDLVLGTEGFDPSFDFGGLDLVGFGSIILEVTFSLFNPISESFGMCI